jgi:hypothetical protein
VLKCLQVTGTPDERTGASLSFSEITDGQAVCLERGRSPSRKRQKGKESLDFIEDNQQCLK